VACRDALLGNDHETNNETMSIARKQILNKQHLNGNRVTVFSVRSVSRHYKRERLGNAVSQSVKRRLGGWCEMAVTPAIS
jgi:hypothetical protein